MVSAISSVQHFPERSIRSLIRFLPRSLDRTTGDGLEVGEILVMVHAGVIAIELVRYPLHCFPVGPVGPASGRALAEAPGDLSGMAGQDTQRTILHPELGFQVSLDMESICGFRESFQDVESIHDQFDVPGPFNQNRQVSLSTAERHAGLHDARITSVHLLATPVCSLDAGEPVSPL
jgi:hypothetical protein